MLIDVQGIRWHFSLKIQIFRWFFCFFYLKSTLKNLYFVFSFSFRVYFSCFVLVFRGFGYVRFSDILFFYLFFFLPYIKLLLDLFPSYQELVSLGKR